MNYIIKSRHYIRKESRKNRRKGVYNVYLVIRLIGTILYINRVAVLAELGRTW
jgi:hypothetical protein